MGRYIRIAAVILLAVASLASCEGFIEQQLPDPTDPGRDGNRIAFGVPSLSKSWDETKAGAPVAACDTLTLFDENGEEALFMTKSVSDWDLDIYSEAAGNETKASLVTSAAAVHSTMGVTAVLKAAGAADSYFFSNAKYGKPGDPSDVWSEEKTYYWPGSAYNLRFFAYSPYECSGMTAPSSASAINDLAISYTVPASAADQTDILAYQTADVAGDSNSPVHLTFQHICSAVKIEAGDIPDGATITSVALKNVYGAGTWKYNGGWTLAAEHNKSFSITMGSGDNCFVMVPQTVPEGATIEVTYKPSDREAARTVSASIAGHTWGQGKITTYKINLTAQYDLYFVTAPGKIVDAHYVIETITIHVGNNLPKTSGIWGTKSWTLSSPDDRVTIRENLTDLEKQGYWIEEDRGANSIKKDSTGDLTFFLFIEENAGSASRDLVLTLTPDADPSFKRQYTVNQLCPSWNGGIGCERIEESGPYPWGAKWGDEGSTTIVYDCSRLSNLKKFSIVAYHAIIEIINFFTGATSGIELEYSPRVELVAAKVSFSNQIVDIAENVDDGYSNTVDLYNFNDMDLSIAFMDFLEGLGASPDHDRPHNPAEFAARSCLMKNKFRKERQRTASGEYVEKAILIEEGDHWYLPAKNEASTIIDNGDYDPLSGDYWTSTADNTNANNAWKFTTSGGSVTSVVPADREDLLNIRAVRKRN